jgi:hypothetical protein
MPISATRRALRGATASGKTTAPPKPRSLKRTQPKPETGSSGESTFSRTVKLGALGLVAAPFVLPIIGAGIVDEVMGSLTGGRWADWLTPNRGQPATAPSYGGYGSSGS